MFGTRNQKPVIDDLLAIPGLGACPPEQLAVLARVTTRIPISPGRVLCVEGGPAAQAFLVVDGEAEVRVGDQTVAHVGAGGFLGEMGLVDPAERSATVVATVPTTVLTMNPAEFATLLSDAPAVAKVMMAEMARRLRDADRRLPATSS